LKENPKRRASAGFPAGAHTDHSEEELSRWAKDLVLHSAGWGLDGRVDALLLTARRCGTVRCSTVTFRRADMCAVLTLLRSYHFSHSGTYVQFLIFLPLFKLAMSFSLKFIFTVHVVSLYKIFLFVVSLEAVPSFSCRNMQYDEADVRSYAMGSQPEEFACLKKGFVSRSYMNTLRTFSASGSGRN
jgi:hypothetical protein